MKEEIVIHNKATSIMFYVDIVFIYLFDTFVGEKATY